MQRYRYPGTASFSTQESDLFHGREDSINELYSLIKLEKLVIVYAKSGFGKSSLVNAGILPKINSDNIIDCFSCLFSGFNENNTANLSEILRSTILKDQINGLSFLNEIAASENSIWVAIKKMQYQKYGLKEQKEIFIFFDQFEEVFTFPEHQINEFKKYLSEIISPNIPQQINKALRSAYKQNKDFLSNDEFNFIYQPLNIRILIAIRSDKMSLLDRLSGEIPNILQKCYELNPLSNQEAIDAIVKPGLSFGDFGSPRIEYTPDVLNSMINFLSNNGEDEIESFQLQILCKYFENEAINQNKDNKNNTVYIDSPTKPEKFRPIIEDHYELTICNLPISDNERYNVRILLEEVLIFEEDQRRIPVYGKMLMSQYNISPELLDTLVNLRLIRIELRGNDEPYYELSHDTLVSPILAAKYHRKSIEKEENMKKEYLETQRKEQEIVTLEKSKKLHQIGKEKETLMQKSILERKRAVFINKILILGKKKLILAGFAYIIFIATFFILIVISYNYFSIRSDIKRYDDLLESANINFQNKINAIDSTNSPVIYRDLIQIFNNYKKIEDK